MDFPDVSLVLQVGIPADADSYTHRVGRTARAGKDGRAVVVLTQAESFFLKVNRQFPIEPYPALAKILNDSSSRDQMNSIMHSIDPESKRKAYQAYLGFMKSYTNKLKMTNADLVRLANDFALNGMQSGEVPEIEKRTVGKMGLKGVPGIRYATVSQDDHPSQKRAAPAPDHGSQGDGLSRRLRHQGVPGSAGALSGGGETWKSWDAHESEGRKPSGRKAPNVQGGRAPTKGYPRMRGGSGGAKRNGTHQNAST